MIDKIQLHRIVVLDTNRFSKHFYRMEYGEGKDTWSIYKYRRYGVIFSYSELTHKLKVEGRLYTLCYANNLVGVLDELWAGISNDTEHQDLDNILNLVNSIIYDLTSYRLDIRSFKVSYIEICFNLITPLVHDYITLFNYKFRSDKKSRYKNFVLELHKQFDSSFYVKTETDFKNNTGSNYAVNFYNKLDQLRYMKSTNKGYEYKNK